MICSYITQSNTAYDFYQSMSMDVFLMLGVTLHKNPQQNALNILISQSWSIGYDFWLALMYLLRERS